MDFITLATETHELQRRVVRHLTDVLGDEEDYDDVIDATTASTSKPLLSKTAEAELYLLATNFLLYVAMVIIATMVARIYFPGSLRRSPLTPERARSFRYRINNTNSHEEEEEYYGSDAEDDNDDGDLENTDEVLDSDEEEHDEREKMIRTKATSHTTTPKKRISFFLEEFQQESLTRAQVLQRLLLCSLMLNITFVTWGVLQERMLTRRYPRQTGEYFTYSYALVFTNRFWTLIMSSMLLWYMKPRLSRTTVIYEYSFPSISNLLSSWCQYEALRYVSFPATTLFKSFKLAPVMLMGKILGNKSYPQYDYIVAMLIGLGISMFMTSTDDLRFGYDAYDDESSAPWTGVMLLSLFLFFDSFTSQFQSRMFQRHRDLSMVELMFATSAFSTVLSFVTLVHTKEVYPALNFVYEHSEIHLHFFLFSICSTLGQIFIYYTIKNFGAVVFTLIMTCRVLLSIAVSCLQYNHPVTSSGFFGLMLVMAAVLYRIKKKAQGQQLIRWQGINDDAKAHELVQEWHEHVDM